MSTDNVTLTGTTLATQIGIGTTTTPDSALVVSGSKANTPTSVGIHIGVESGTTAGIELCSATLQSLAYIDFTCVGTDYKGRILYDIGTSSMAFQTNLIERMRLTPTAATFAGLVVHSNNTIMNGNLTVGDTVGRTAKFVRRWYVRR